MNSLNLPGVEEAKWLDWIHGIFQEELEATLKEALSDMFPEEPETATSLIEKVENKLS
ncbi:MAG: hypothetical protein OQK35_01295 [Alphaproteobacteria bacterium]|nr:hypothetical protein [Rhodospirillales bacterium]MCW9044945.1 hypothetical protein [Alphaproteobacteria bacterium]